MSDPLDDEFNAFLAEVEALSMQGGVDEEHQSVSPTCLENVQNSSNVTDEKKVSDGDATARNSVELKQNNKKVLRQQKESLIKNAESSRIAWTEFSKVDLTKTSADTDRPKISFGIQKDKSKTKKKGSGASLINKGGDAVGSNGLTKNYRNVGQGTLPTASNNLSCNGGTPNSLLCPSWTLVIDTSSLVNDSGLEAQKLFDLASNVSLARFDYQKSKAGREPGRNHASTNTIVDEPIHIVIPYKVFSELEYQSKSQNLTLAFSARTVIRMLREELQHSNNQVTALDAPEKIVRSQTLLESQDTAKKFVSNDTISPPTNDDHIIACALVEHEKWMSNSEGSISGGTVMITSDNNMACKAYSNGLKVHSPSSFCSYYLERMNSLRQRANSSLTDSALRR